MLPGTDATLLNQVLFGTRQPTQRMGGLYDATVVACSESVVTFSVDVFSTIAGYSAPLPAGWGVLDAGTSLLVAFVRTPDGGTDIWAVAHR